MVLDVFDNDNKDVIFVVLPACQYLAELLLHNDIPLHFLPLCEQVGLIPSTNNNCWVLTSNLPQSNFSLFLYRCAGYFSEPQNQRPGHSAVFSWLTSVVVLTLEVLRKYSTTIHLSYSFLSPTSPSVALIPEWWRPFSPTFSVFQIMWRMLAGR